MLEALEPETYSGPAGSSIGACRVREPPDMENQVTRPIYAGLEPEAGAVAVTGGGVGAASGMKAPVQKVDGKGSHQSQPT